jgi:flagellar biosynthetic protein FliP
MSTAGIERAEALRGRLHSLVRTMAFALLAMCASGAMLYLCTAHAADLNITAFTVKTNPDGTSDYSVSLQVVVLMTLLSFLPSILIMMTSFTRIVIVLAILRQAMGLQTSPSNQVLIGISLFLTLFIMTPVFDQVYTDAIEPYLNDQIQAREAFQKAQVPLKHFMVEQTRLSDLNAFSDYAGEKADKPEDLPMRVVIPAFMISELKTAFQIGFMIFLPFLIIDLVVASILMAMGMMMLSPMIVSLPFKLMLFVLVDGWTLITGTLVQSYGLGVPT